jgi:hypothetical protein
VLADEDDVVDALVVVTDVVGVVLELEAEDFDVEED